jgi:hypothetical protein
MGNLLIFSFKTSFYLKGFGGDQAEIDPTALNCLLHIRWPAAPDDPDCASNVRSSRSREIVLHCVNQFQMNEDKLLKVFFIDLPV